MPAFRSFLEEKDGLHELYKNGRLISSIVS